MADISQSTSPGSPNDTQAQTEQQIAASGEAPEHDQVDGEWCKVFCSKNEDVGQEFYFTNLKTGESTWTEPQSKYWLWDYGTGSYHVSGLQKPTSKEQLAKEAAIRESEKGPLQYDEKDPANGWQGYNPRVHGPYDKNAPYTAFHSWLEYKKNLEENPQAAAAVQQQGGMAYQNYDSTAQFNAHSGRFQADNQSADRFDAANKAGRQMNAYFDVDAAANSHDGRSLKEERRNHRLSKKEVKEMNEKRKQKKKAKQLAFLRS